MTGPVTGAAETMKLFPRRWITFSLASLFGAVAIIAALCALTIKRLELYTDQVTLVARIAQVDSKELWQYFDGEQPVSISLGSGRIFTIELAPPEGWMSDVADYLGRAYPADVTRIVLAGRHHDYGAMLGDLRKLPRLKSLILQDVRVTSGMCESLASFKDLKELRLRSTTASLEQIRELQLRLPNTSVTYD